MEQNNTYYIKHPQYSLPTEHLLAPISQDHSDLMSGGSRVLAEREAYPCPRNGFLLLLVSRAMPSEDWEGKVVRGHRAGVVAQGVETGRGRIGASPLVKKVSLRRVSQIRKQEIKHCARAKKKITGLGKGESWRPVA